MEMRLREDGGAGTGRLGYGYRSCRRLKLKAALERVNIEDSFAAPIAEHWEEN
jgi:hypothetical protein